MLSELVHGVVANGSLQDDVAGAAGPLTDWPPGRVVSGKTVICRCDLPAPEKGPSPSSTLIGCDFQV